MRWSLKLLTLASLFFIYILLIYQYKFNFVVITTLHVWSKPHNTARPNLSAFQSSDDIGYWQISYLFNNSNFPTTPLVYPSVS